MQPLYNGGMAELSSQERDFLQAVSRLSFCNPFLPERMDIEREALGAEYQPGEPIWSFHVGRPAGPTENVVRITRRVEELAARLRNAWSRSGSRPSKREVQLYEYAVLWLLYHDYEQRLQQAILRVLEEGRSGTFSFYRQFRDDHQRYFDVPGYQQRGDIKSKCHQMSASYYGRVEGKSA